MLELNDIIITFHFVRPNMVLFLFQLKQEVFMRTTSKPQPNQALILPTKVAIYALVDELTLTDYTGKKCVSENEIKHIHLNYTLENLNIINN